VIEREFLDYSAAKLAQYLERIEICLGKLDDDRIWFRGCENENSIGNLCLHLEGNVRQWIVCGVGGMVDSRDRDAEFAASGGLDGAALGARLRSTVEAARDVVAALPLERLSEPITVQKYAMTVFGAIYHVVEHFSHHTGQILFATKALCGEDLGFYRHLSKETHWEKTP
jgi:uncharacterized damage-inducible protein DinB